MPILLGETSLTAEINDGSRQHCR